MLTTATAVLPADPPVYRIGRVTLQRNPVFENADSTGQDAVSALANRLHILTRSRIIENELLFEEGDAYDFDLVEETERNLRRLAIIGDVFIQRDTIDDRTIDLTVNTRDRWSLEAGGAYKTEGGIRTSRITLQDHNFLGNAQTVSASINRRSDRATPEGLDLVLRDRRLLGSLWEGSARYKRAEELELRSVRLERSFYTEAATWAASLYADRRSVRLYTYEGGRRIHDFLLHQRRAASWVAVSSGDLVKLRLGAAYLKLRTSSNELGLRPFDNFQMATVSLGTEERTFYEDTYLNNFGRTEDVPLGYLANLALGRNFQREEEASFDTYSRLDLKFSQRLGGRHYLGYQASISGFFTDARAGDVTLRLGATYHHRLRPRQTLAGRAVIIVGSRWSPYRQVTLGAPSGLRGYQAHSLAGQRLFLLNVENRIFTPLKVWIFRLGGTIFFDVGAVWQESETASLADLHSAYGLGLRIENSVQKGSGILRIDLAFTPVQRGLAEISFTSQQLFQAFTDIAFIPPTFMD